jgi:DNA-binding NtrC family response regulator
VILAGEGTILSSHLSLSFGGSAGSASGPPAMGVSMGASGAATVNGDELRIQVGSTIEQAERALIELTLEHTRHNKTRAAEVLGISQKTLFNKLKEYGAQTAGA